MLDALLSVAVITRSARPNVAAFKFLYAGARSALQDQAESAAVKAEARANIATHRPQMTHEEQTEADSFLAERPRGPYWYSGDFRSPSDVAAQYAPTLSDLYKILSGTAHAGFLGMGLSRDDPARRDVNPRRDPRAEGFALFTSSRLLNEITLLRAEFEGLDAPKAAAVTRRVAAVRPVG